MMRFGVCLAALAAGTGNLRAGGADDVYVRDVRPLLAKYCNGCHSGKMPKGELDLERFRSLADVRRDLLPWKHLIEQVETGEMPPSGKAQPTADERKRLLAWTRGTLDAEARLRAGDPGRVPLRRLSNAEYDATVRDLTGVDLKPAREFPADGAGGEGFANAAEALSDVTPALFDRYLKSAKEIAQRAVITPDGFRFSLSPSRRDWTDEETAQVRRFLAERVPADGKLPIAPYLVTLVRHRTALVAGKASLAEVAVREKLSPKYLGLLWATLQAEGADAPLGAIRARWRTASEADVPALVAEIGAWQSLLWKSDDIFAYIRPEGSGYVENLTRQRPTDPAHAESQSLRLALKPAAGQAEVTLTLASRHLVGAGPVVWRRPRFEAPGQPTLLLRDYPDFGRAFEVDLPSAFADAEKYLAIVASRPRGPVAEAAKTAGVNAALLERWLALVPIAEAKAGERTVKAIPLTLLDEKTPTNPDQPAILGWRKGGTDLPLVVSNASNETLAIPGRITGRGVAVHPMPKEVVAVAWTSPITGDVAIRFRVAHAHPACGNGVAWRLERRREGIAAVLGVGLVDLGKETGGIAKASVVRGDVVALLIDARDANHVCDLTEVSLALVESAKPGRTWDLAGDVANTIQSANPHADRHGHAGVWSFLRGPSLGMPGGAPNASPVPPDSVLGRWRGAAADPARAAETAALARETQSLLSGPRPTKANAADLALYDRLVAWNSPLFAGVDVASVAKPRAGGVALGLPRDAFSADGDLASAAGAPIAIRLPAALFRDRVFVIDGALAGPVGDRVAQFRASTEPPTATPSLDPSAPLVASTEGYAKLRKGFSEFRERFPLFVAYPQVIPTHAGHVTLKMFHREDDALARLFLSDADAAMLDRLWARHRFVSRQPAAENDYLPQYIGFVSQDQPKAMLAHFQSQAPAFQAKADAFAKEELAAEPKQLAALDAFAARAFRRPLTEAERAELTRLYQAIRAKGTSHDEAFRGVLTRVLASPAFLFRVEAAPSGTQPQPVDDHALATRLSYFLWSSMPDAELTELASKGRLRDPQILAAQTKRMLADPRVRALALEFGAQWIHVRDVDTLKEKNEKLFPTFDAKLRHSIREEAVLFFQDLFQSDGSLRRLLEADDTFLDETLARHYGIPGVKGPEWRRVNGVQKYGRGGLLGMAAVHAKQSGASRTSPVLRGNWVVETLLGEKLPRPPANVPTLPDVDAGEGQTTRQRVERHVADKGCAACHVRIDPFGFAFENFDPIGRFRTKETGGQPVDAKATLRDGTTFEGIDGLRAYLASKKRTVIHRVFCKRLVGYALGRATTLSDEPLIERMVTALEADPRVGTALVAIVTSEQFLKIRGRDAAE